MGNILIKVLKKCNNRLIKLLNFTLLKCLYNMAKLRAILYAAIVLFISSRQLMAQSDYRDREMAFAKLYSTLKFFYPDPQLKGFPWSGLAVYGHQLALEKKSTEQYMAALQKLTQQIAPGIQIVQSNKFNPQLLQPAKRNDFQTTAFWQHTIGLQTARTHVAPSGSLNYIYGQASKQYVLMQAFSPKQKGILGKKIKLSLWIKWESGLDTSLAVLKLHTYDAKEKTFRDLSIKTTQSDWKQYTVEMDYPSHVPIDRLLISFPERGALYIDDCQMFVLDDKIWTPVTLNNMGFEQIAASGNVVGWEDPLLVGTLTSIVTQDVKEGQKAVRLAAVEEQIKYQPQDLEIPATIQLIDNWVAHIPLQLYAKDAAVFPAADPKNIQNWASTCSALTDSNADKKHIVIAALYEIWSYLHHDGVSVSPYFQPRNDLYFLNALDKAQNSNTTWVWDNFYTDYFVWLNDPQLQLQLKRINPEEKRKFRLPVDIVIGNQQCIVSSVKNPKLPMQAGDIVKKINHLQIDSLLYACSRQEVGKFQQWMMVSKLLDCYQTDSIAIEYISLDNTTHNATFSPQILQQRTIVADQDTIDENTQQDMHESAMQQLKAKQAAYFNLVSNSPADKSNFSSIAKMDSLINQFNQYKTVILDLRGRPNSVFLNYLIEHIPNIDTKKKWDVVKHSILPHANFNFDTTNLIIYQPEAKVLTCKIIALVNYKTLGAAERSLMVMKEAGAVTLVGETTAGAGGIMHKVNISDKLDLFYTTGLWRTAKGMGQTNILGNGIKPDVNVYQTSKGIAAHTDEVFMQALSILKN